MVDAVIGLLTMAAPRREDLKTFTLNEAQMNIFDEWAKKHRDDPNHREDSFGSWVKFIFLPSGIGTSASAECLCCGEKISLVDPDFDP